MRRPRLPRPRLPRPSAPSAAAVGDWLRARLHGMRYALEDFVYLVGRVPRAIGRGARGFWMGLELRTRQRLALAILGAGLAALVLALVVPVLPCQFPGGDACPPPDDAEEIVPADSLGYVHLNLESDTDQYEHASALADDMPVVTDQLIGALTRQIPGPRGAAASFERDIAPWFGGQAAMAVIPRGPAADEVQLLEAADSEKAARYAESIAAGTPEVSDYQGTEIAVDARGLATASIEGFLAIGTETAVRRILDVAHGAEDARALADDVIATEVRDELPPERFASAYLSAEGIETLVGRQGGPFASLETFVDSSASMGAAASVGVTEDGVEVAVRSRLDPERSKSNPGFFAAFPEFDPELADHLDPATLAYVGIGDPGTTVRELLAQATAEAPALAEGFTALAKRLRELGKVDVEEDLLPALGGEAAFALQPGPESARPKQPQTTVPAPAPEGLPQGPAPAPPEEPPVPYLQFLSEEVDSERAKGALARLQGPIAEALDPATTLQAPVFERREIEGAEAQVLRLGPTINLTYSLFDSSLAVATQPQGVEQLVTGDGGLEGDDRFERATDEFPDEASLFAYLSLRDLVELAELEGLRESPSYTPVRDEVRLLDTLGLAVSGDEQDLATDVRVIVSEPPPDEGSGEPAPAD